MTKRLTTRINRFVILLTEVTTTTSIHASLLFDNFPEKFRFFTPTNLFVPRYYGTDRTPG